jgi:hypothetical protein
MAKGAPIGEPKLRATSYPSSFQALCLEPINANEPDIRRIGKARADWKTVAVYGSSGQTPEDDDVF